MKVSDTLKSALRTWLKRPFNFVLVFITFAVIVNIVEFPFIDKTTRHNYKAIYAYDSVDVVQVSIDRDNSSRETVAPYYYFGVLFPDSVVIMPTRERIADAIAIRSLGLASEIQYRDYEADRLFASIDLSTNLWDLAALAEDRGSTLAVIERTFGIATSHQPSGIFVILHDPYGKFYYVDTSLLGEAARKELGLG